MLAFVTIDGYRRVRGVAGTVGHDNRQCWHGACAKLSYWWA